MVNVVVVNDRFLLTLRSVSRLSRRHRRPPSVCLVSADPTGGLDSSAMTRGNAATRIFCAGRDGHSRCRRDWSRRRRLWGSRGRGCPIIMILQLKRETVGAVSGRSARSPSVTVRGRFVVTNQSIVIAAPVIIIFYF